MVKYKFYLFPLLIIFFLFFSFSPTLFELSRSNQLKDPARQFILEHNYYWPDFNLYLSKIRQGYDGRFTALEKYTSEPHQGSLIQEFYVVLGQIGRTLNIEPNFAYQLGRLILSPLLLYLIIIFSINFFRSFNWQILAFLIVITSGSFPRFYTNSQGILQVGRFMEWWSNIDALQRITFIPHILFGQVVSLFLLYRLTPKNAYLTSEASSLAPARSASTGQAIKQCNNVTMLQFIKYILLGNAVGLVFPPSLITLNGVILLTLIIQLNTEATQYVFARSPDLIGTTRQSHIYLRSGLLRLWLAMTSRFIHLCVTPVINKFKFRNLKFDIDLSFEICHLSFLILTLPSLLYLFFVTRSLPWSALVDYHRTHPMLIPFAEYIKGTGPVFFLGLAGAILSIFNRDRKFQPLILWLLVTFFFAILFTHVKDQSPLRFTQTGLFIPLGILATYLFYQLFHLSHLSDLFRKTIVILILLYLFSSLFMMEVSWNWQIDWISQRLRASVPLVPDPPQAMYPLKEWMDGINWLGNNTDRNNDVVLSDVTAGNYIPAYSGNTVYFGQSNTVNYEKKQMEVWQFFEGSMTAAQSRYFLSKNRIRYIFVSYQEKAGMKEKALEISYPFVKSVYKNNLVTIYTY